VWKQLPLQPPLHLLLLLLVLFCHQWVGLCLPQHCQLVLLLPGQSPYAFGHVAPQHTPPQLPLQPLPLLVLCLVLHC
jgi:hypothetical protein